MYAVFAAICVAACRHLGRTKRARKPLGEGVGASKGAVLKLLVHICKHVRVHMEAHVCVHGANVHTWGCVCQ